MTNSEVTVLSVGHSLQLLQNYRTGMKPDLLKFKYVNGISTSKVGESGCCTMVFSIKLLNSLKYCLK